MRACVCMCARARVCMRCAGERVRACVRVCACVYKYSCACVNPVAAVAIYCFFISIGFCFPSLCS